MKVKRDESKNLLNWYPFKVGSRILEFSKDKISDLYDYIIIDAPLEKDLKLEDVIKDLKNNLKDDGKFLISLPNKFGLTYFSGTPDDVTGKQFRILNGYNNDEIECETYSKRSLDLMFERLELNTNFYYPLPNHILPAVIFSDDYLPNYTNIDKYFTYGSEDTAVVFNEIDIFREILKEDESMFKFFANSYFIEASKTKQPIEYKYISFNNLRKKKYRLITKIADSFVEKDVATMEALDHYVSIKNNIEKINNMGLKTLDYVWGDKIRSKYIDQKLMLSNVLSKLLEENKQEDFYNIIDRYIELLKSKSHKIQDNEETIFKKYNIEIDSRDLDYLEDGMWDMTFSNCFYIENEFNFFDQEWNNKNVPVQYILFRSFKNTISLRRYIDVDELIQKYDLKKYEDAFNSLDLKIQEEIRDNEAWKFYKPKNIININDTLQEIHNVNIRSEAKDKAIDNLTKEKENLQKALDSKLSVRIKRKLKGN